MPTFSEAHPALDDQVGWFSLRLRGAVAQGELLNLVYEPFAPADAKLFDAARLPAGPEPHLRTGTEMKLAVTHLSVRPVRRNPQTGQPERLVSFDYRYQPAARRAPRATTAHHARGRCWPVATGTKSAWPGSGVYKLDKAALSQNGPERGQPQPQQPAPLRQLDGHSAPAQRHLAARRPGRKQHPVRGQPGQRRFDDDEYFLFYSPGAHTWEAQGGVFRHRNNIYTDTTYYFVGANGTAGRRMPTVAALPATPGPPPSARSPTATFTSTTW